MLGRATKLGLAYGATGFSAALLHNVFLTYYVHLFMAVYKLESMSFIFYRIFAYYHLTPEGVWFYVGEVIYMIWNSLNDPVFGWIITERLGNEIKKRLMVIRYGGAVWAVVFLLLFLPPPFAAESGV